MVEEIKGHSNLDGFLEGELVTKIRNRACYSDFTYVDGVYDKIIVYHNPDMIDKIPDIEYYCNWLLNDEFVGDAFLTKDFYEGMAEGFELNINSHATYMVSGMNWLRYPFECYQSTYNKPYMWNFHTFMERYNNPNFSLFASRNVQNGDSCWTLSKYNSNHVPQDLGHDYKSYFKNAYIEMEDEQTFATGYDKYARRNITSSWKMFGKSLSLSYTKGVSKEKMFNILDSYYEEENVVCAA